MEKFLILFLMFNKTDANIFSINVYSMNLKFICDFIWKTVYFLYHGEQILLDDKIIFTEIHPLLSGKSKDMAVSKTATGRYRKMFTDY